MSNKHKRRNFFIKKDFQGRLILGYFLFVTGGCLLFALILAAFSADTLTVVYQNHDLQLGQTPLMLAKKMLAAQWVFVVLGGSLIVLAALFITHRLAGPVFRLERALENMITGNLNDIIHLRKKDEGKHLAAKINSFNHQLSQQIRLIDTHSKSIEELIGQYSSENTPPSGESNIPEQLLEAIKTHNHAIREVTGAFILTDE
ncbi:MAG TPA: methyl-accepting chemotaxis protein [Desulfobulbus sp.]|nr:methyl-accepting chemotaxis protein [Desulfobulbus sp.]